MFALGVKLLGIRSNTPLNIDNSVQISCRTNIPADYIELSRSNTIVSQVNSNTVLSYTIPAVNESIHDNTFMCNARLLGSNVSSSVVVSVQGISAYIILGIIITKVFSFSSNHFYSYYHFCKP